MYIRTFCNIPTVHFLGVYVHTHVCIPTEAPQTDRPCLLLPGATGTRVSGPVKCPKKGFSISTLIHGPQRWQFPVFPALQKTSPNIVCYVAKPHHRHKDTRGNLARELLRTQGKAGLYIFNTRLNTNAWEQAPPKPAYFVIRKHSLQVICLLLDSQNKRKACISPLGISQ